MLTLPCLHKQDTKSQILNKRMMHRFFSESLIFSEIFFNRNGFVLYADKAFIDLIFEMEGRWESGFQNLAS